MQKQKIGAELHIYLEEGTDNNKRWDDRTDHRTFEVRKGDTTVHSVWTNSVRNAFRKQAGVGYTAGGKSSSSKALDRTRVVSPQPTLAAVVEGRNGSIKEWKFQR